MSTIYSDSFHGGKGHTDGDDLPLALAFQDVADDLATLKPTTLTAEALVQDNSVIDGGIVGAPTTPSTQASGVGDTVWNVDVAAGRWKVNDVEADVAASVDEVLHTGSLLLANGESVAGWVVVAESGGSLALDSVLGAAATTGLQVPPTDAEITVGVGHANWAKAALCVLNRTGDTTVTQSEDNTYREQMAGPLVLALVNAIRANQVSAAATLKTINGGER